MQNPPKVVVVVLHYPFQRMGARRNSAETQQSGHVLRSRPKVKMEEVVPKMARRKDSDAEQSRWRPKLFAPCDSGWALRHSACRDPDDY